MLVRRPRREVTLVAIHQPEYLPYFGFFSKAASVDLFVLLDNVQFSKDSFQNRNRIKTKDGWQWLTVPVRTRGRFAQAIDGVRIDNSLDWKRKHWRSILLNYERSAYFNSYRNELEGVYTTDWELLEPLNEQLIRFLMRELGIEVETMKASEIGASGSKTDLLIDICRRTGADGYLSGRGGRDYIDPLKFEAAHLAHAFHDFDHPVYEQQFGGFLKDLSIIDLLFNMGEKAKSYFVRKKSA